MAVTSVTRDQKSAEVMRLHAAGLSQRAIAARVGISRPMVQRILDSSDPLAVAGLEDDPDGVIAEFDEMSDAAAADGSLDAYRRLHEVALVCHANGYDVRWHPLRLLSALSAAELDATSQSVRRALNAEILKVYADMREWRDRDG